MNTNLIRQTLEQLQLPYLIADADLNIQWSNSCLQKHYPYLAVMRSLDALLFGYEKEEVLSRLSTADGPLTLPCRLPMVLATLTLSPLNSEDGSEADSIVVSITGAPSMDSAPNPLLSSVNKSLRMPLDHLFGTLSYLRFRLEEEYSPELLSMTRDCYQLLRGCISISEYSEYIHGTASLDRTVSDLGDFVRQQLEPSIPALRRMGIELTFSLPEQPLYVLFDSQKLAVVLFSLISNSCMFCEGKNSIHVTVTSGETHARILVSDKGYGIPAEIMPKVMEPYFSRGLDDSAQPGIGLGLPLSKAIIEQHGGSIALQSVQDQGTTVALSLPLKVDLPASGKLHAPPPTYMPERYPKRNIFLSTVLPPEELQ